MDEAKKTEFPSNRHLVRPWGSLPDVKPRVNARFVIRSLLHDAECWKVLEHVLLAKMPITRHKVGDVIRIADILREHDTKGQLDDFFGKDEAYTLGMQALNVMREKFTFDKNWKIVGVTQKVVALMQ